jgi:predicted component of type VI protein secretion system
MFRWSVLFAFMVSLFVTGCSSSTPEPTKVDAELIKKARSKNLDAKDD